MGLTTESLRPSSQRSEEPEPAEQYTVTVMGPGFAVGPQAAVTDLDAAMECVRDNVENGSIVTVARVKGQA